MSIKIERNLSLRNGGNHTEITEAQSETLASDHVLNSDVVIHQSNWLQCNAVNNMCIECSLNAEHNRDWKRGHTIVSAVTSISD